MANFNKVILMGNLTRDPELRYLPSNMPVCEFGMAVNRKWKDKDGNMKEDVCFVDVSAFARGAEVINQYMTKGKPILIEGRLRYDSWTAQDGSKRSKLSVVAENFQFVGGRDGGPGGSGGGAPAAQNYQPAGAAPQYGSRPAAPTRDAPPSGPPDSEMPPAYDDIPF